MTPDGGHEPHRPTHAPTLPTAGEPYTPDTFTPGTQLLPEIAIVAAIESLPDYTTLCPIT
jgi:hypothetical protein